MGNKKLKSQGRYFPAFFFLASARRSVFFRRLARFLALSLPLLFPIRPQHSPSCRAVANSQADSSPVQLVLLHPESVLRKPVSEIPLSECQMPCSRTERAGKP